MLVPLSFAIQRIFKSVLKFYKLHRGKGSEAVDMPTFFKSKRASAAEFKEFWDDASADGRAFEKHLTNTIAAIGK
jgi:hypothetical protein